MDDRTSDRPTSDPQYADPAGAPPRWQLDLIGRWAEQHDGALLDLGAGSEYVTSFGRAKHYLL